MTGESCYLLCLRLFVISVPSDQRTIECIKNIIKINLDLVFFPFLTT